MSILLILLITLLAGGGCLWYLWPKTQARDSGNTQEESSYAAYESDGSSEPAFDAESSTEAVVPDEPSGQAEESGSLEAEQESQLAEVVDQIIEPYDFAQPVPESEPVDDSYFDDALFIGDSRTQGFILYSGLANTTAYADKGLSVDKVFSKEFVHENGADYTVADTLAHHPNEYKKVYLMFGVNELGWNYPEVFQQRYREVVREVQKTQTDAVIYVQSILPVSREKSQSSDIYNMERVNLFNGLLKTMAEEEQVCYLDVAAGVADEEGYLPDDASTDGVHLNKAYCQIWLDYLKAHTVPAPPIGAASEEPAA